MKTVYDPTKNIQEEYILYLVQRSNRNYKDYYSKFDVKASKEGVDIRHASTPITRSEVQAFFFIVADFIMSMNSGFREAPPTKNPSTSGCAANSLQFAPFTEPP